MDPTEKLARVLAHYLKTVATASGLRWTAVNDDDIRRAIADFVAELQPETTIPTAYPEERKTERRKPDLPPVYRDPYKPTEDDMRWWRENFGSEPGARSSSQRPGAATTVKIRRGE